MGTTTTTAQQIALAVAPKVGGAISIFGSLWIFLEVLGCREKRNQVYHRIMFMISMFDIMVSSGAFASTWPMPPPPDDETTADPWKGRGTAATCDIQGFAMQLGATLFTYNAALSVFYVLMITFGVKERILRKYEWALHGVPLSFGISTATVAAVKGWYHEANLWCWIAQDPACEDEDYKLHNQEYCHQYQHIWIYRWAFFFAPLWACFVIQMTCMFVVARSVHRQEKQAEKYMHPSRHFISNPLAANDRGVVVANNTLGNSMRTSMGNISQSFTNNLDQKSSPEHDVNCEERATTDHLAQESSAETRPTPDRRDLFLKSFTQRLQSSFNGMDSSRSRSNEFRRTRQVATQAILYICAFYLTYFFATLNRIIQQVNNSSPFGVLLMHSLTLPQQGFWNFLIYRRPLYLQLRRQHKTRWETIRACVVLSWFREDQAVSTRDFRPSRQRSFRQSFKKSCSSPHRIPPKAPVVDSNVSNMADPSPVEKRDDLEAFSQHSIVSAQARRNHQSSNVTFSEIIQSLAEDGTMMNHDNTISHGDPEPVTGIPRNDKRPCK